MHASPSLKAAGALAAALLLGTASAAPRIAVPTLAPRADPTDLWVTVDESGKPVTVTPVLTTISGTPTVVSAAPHEITGTVFTQTDNGNVRTSTGDAPPPEATGKDGSGVFPVCKNVDGANAPFCQPEKGDTLTPGKTYYVTWDPKFFNGTNTTVVVTGSYINDTTGAILSQAFSSDKMAAGWGFYAWSVDKAIMQGGNPTNVTLVINALSPGSQAMNPFAGPTVRVANPEPYRQPPPKAPTGPALYIGLPTILGFVALCLIGTCIWNRKTRRISLGNIMSRSRHGYGAGKSRAQRLGLRSNRKNNNKDQSIHLMEREVGNGNGSGGPRYRDEDMHAAPAQHDDWDLPRRDSDALGSLAGTPTEDRHMDFRRPGAGAAAAAPQIPAQNTGNAFRDEMNRQQRERE
ncbi:uncharacterized protein E0L32_009510 [Thyridium curvatum]|uniref:Uncharacterized protein n=1 Tax=Thyridium curvatum TaxID=1093900 RepID=A0A507AWW5_9PEZI|nr:uncharacterized protein E0L32_009510 [Thyridium curvatum]TPX09318.1 hypothetical protein E0L32_009510 [Thyridium curvatum]